MFDNLTALGYGLVVFALTIGIGTVVLQNFGNSVGGTANSTVNTLQGYLGTSAGGLVNWTPAIIALAVGMLFLGAFFMRKGRKV